MRPKVLHLTGVIVVVEVGQIGIPVFQSAEEPVGEGNQRRRPPSRPIPC